MKQIRILAEFSERKVNENKYQLLGDYTKKAKKARNYR